MSILDTFDPEVATAIRRETERQEFNLELIASENFVSEAVLEAQGSVLTNKYAEGYPGKRYYGGCEHVDVVENLAIERAKELFGADHANVQPHAGSQANMAVYFTVLKPGDTILGMSLPHGGHLTHGSPVNISGKWFKVIPYGLDPVTELIDYAAAERLAHEHKPKLIIAGGSAYARIIDFARFRNPHPHDDEDYYVDERYQAKNNPPDRFPCNIQHQNNICDWNPCQPAVFRICLLGDRGKRQRDIHIHGKRKHQKEHHESTRQQRRQCFGRIVLCKHRRRQKGQYRCYRTHTHPSKYASEHFHQGILR
jgi:hypothetical protein